MTAASRPALLLATPAPEALSQRPRRVAVVVSHPIQHFCPQYASWARLPEVELKVFFASQHGLVEYEDKNFGKTIRWHGLAMDFPHEFLPGAESRALDEATDSPDLAARLAAFAPNALIVYGYSQVLQRRAARWAKQAGVPTLMISDAEPRSRRRWLKTFAKALLLPFWLRRFTLFLTVGDANEAYYRRYGVADQRLVRCFFPIDRAHYDQVLAGKSSARQRVRQAHGIPQQHKVVLNVGKLVPWKRQGELVSFANRVQGRYGNITVILAGTGKDEAELRALCRREGPGGVVFAGFVPPETLAEYYCAADVYVACSVLEPHSLAVSEAIYCGLPVVISDRCGSYGPSDDVRPGLNGFVYRSGDIAELARLLLLILGDEALQARMGKASSAIGKQHQDLAHGKALSQALQLIAAMAKEEPTMKLELARRRIRQVLGYRSPIYRLAAELFNRYEILRREGWRTLWQIEKASHASGPEITLNLRSLRHPIAVRPGTEDVPALINNAIREEYGQLPADFKPAVIVDAGAYIGDTSAYFLSRFPASRIIALEPNTDSFPLASRNLEPYGKQVSLLPAALWSETTTVCFAGSQTGAAISASGSEVPTITMPALMEEFGLDFIDLLKLDIEGAEAQVIPTGLGGWLEKVGMILLETHGADIEAAVIPLLCQSGFSCRQMRNVWYCKRTGGPVLEC